jgi:hypothetical protein
MTTHPTRLSWSGSRRVGSVNIPVDVCYSDDGEQSAEGRHATPPPGTKT